VATVYQRCKSDKRSVYFPCSTARCGHPWTVRYRESPGSAAPERQKSFGKRPEAEAFAAKLHHDRYEGLYLDPKRGEILLRDYAAEWLERQVIAQATYANYESFIRIHLTPHLGHKKIAGVERKDIDTFVAALSKQLAPGTVADRMKMVKYLFATAVEDKRRTDNPADGVKLPRTVPRAVDEDEIPTLHEVDLIAKQISPQYRLTIYLQAAAGLRISETLAITAECRRPEFLRVRRQVSSKANREDCRTRFVPLKHRAEGEYRDVPLPEFLDQEIEAHLHAWPTMTVEGVEVLFPPRERRKGTMPTATTYAYHFRKALTIAGIVTPDGRPKYTPHSLRHFFASTALAHGIPIHEVSRWLGHRSIKTTVDVYGHLVPESWNRCRTVMQTALRPGSCTE
jgi:integrase